MKVLKFGGSSVGSVIGLHNIKKIAEGADQPLIVVVSALGGITDKLIALGKRAGAGDIAYVGDLDAIIRRHLDLVKTEIAEEKQAALMNDLEALFHDLRSILHGVYLIQDLTATSPDEQFRHENFLPSIIPRDLWEQVQELMAMRKRESVRAGEGRPILRYSGLIACGDCGRAFTGKRVKQKNGERVEYICSTYLRYGKEHCGAHPIREEYLDDIVRQELQNTKQQYHSLWTQLEKAIEGWLPKTTNTQQQLRKQRERIELLEEEVETILMERIRDKENAQRYDRMIAKREEQIANAKKRIEELENIGQIIRSRQAKLRKDIGLIDDILADGKISEAHLRMLIERIYVYETEGGLSLEIKVKAPFQNHTDSYDNGVLTNSEIEELIGVN